MEALLNYYRVVDTIRSDILGGHFTGMYTLQTATLRFDTGLKLTLELTDFNDARMAHAHGYDVEKPWTITATFHRKTCLTRHLPDVTNATIVHYACRAYPKCGIPAYNTPRLVGITVNRKTLL